MARAGLALSALLAAGMGFVAVQRPELVAVMVGLAILGVALAQHPVLLAVLSVPGVLITLRVAGDAIAVAQMMGALAAFFAIPAITRDRLPARYWHVAGLVGIYLAAIAVVILANPSLAAAQNWVLRANILAGGLLVGAWLAKTDRLRPALVFYLVAVAILALAATIAGILSDFEPATVAGYHKNYIGSVTATGLIVLAAAGSVHQLARRWVVALALPMLAGLLASQSRGGGISLAIGLIVWALAERVPGASKRLATALVIGGTAAAIAAQSVLAQLQLRTELTITSTQIRQMVTEESLALWESSPWLGVGLRFHVDPDYASPILKNGASNVVVEALAEGGVLSLTALLLLAGGTAFALFRARTALATAALAVLVARLAHGTVDVYWTFVTTYIPWLMVGAALASIDPAETTPDPQEEDERVPRRSVTGTIGSDTSAS